MAQKENIWTVCSDIWTVLSWIWLLQSDLKLRTEATICAAQEQALRANYTKNKIDKTSESLFYRMCGERGETVQHIYNM